MKTTVSPVSKSGSRSKTRSSPSRSPWMSPIAKVRATKSIVLRLWPRRHGLGPLEALDHGERLLDVRLHAQLRDEGVDDGATPVDDERCAPGQDSQRRT